jgi:threonine dehydrogenase-like Zn-dependent dehydrogenase
VLTEVPTPEPGPNQVLIKIRASGMCYTDVHQTHGEIPSPFPRTLGHEPVGEIVAVGVGVTGRQVGDRVGVPWVRSSYGRCEWCLPHFNDSSFAHRPRFSPDFAHAEAELWHGARGSTAGPASLALHTHGKTSQVEQRGKLNDSRFSEARRRGD